MGFMNGGFRWTVLISLAAGAWLAGTVATLQLREMSDRRLTKDAAATAIAAHDSMVHVISDSLLANDARIVATLDILRERGYRLYDGLTDIERSERRHAHKEIERDERRR